MMANLETQKASDSPPDLFTMASGPGETVLLDPHGIPLHPQPTPDPLDPLNWRKSQKYLTLAIACITAFFPLYLTTTPIASFFLLQEQFNATYSEVNWTLAVPSLGLVLGPLLFSSFADVYGRRPILVGATSITLAATGCSTIPGINFAGYLICRFLQGLGAGPTITIGFAIVRDISWEHERGFNVGLWVMALDIGGLVGGLVGGFTAAAGPFWAQYHLAIAYAVVLCLETFLLSETLYPRDWVLERVARGEAFDDIMRTREIKIWTLKHIPGVPRATGYEAATRFLKLAADPRLLLVMLPFIFFQYWWILSLFTMEPIAYAHFSSQVQGLFFLGLILGVLVIEICCSGRIIDKITAHLALRNGNVRTPAMCLWLGYPAVVLSAAGLILFGFSVDHHWHWIFGPLSFFLFAAGLQMGNVSVTAYALCAYPNHAVEVMTLYSALYNMSSFLNPWFINYWVESVGFSWAFLTQGLTVLLIIPIYAVMQRWGSILAREVNFE